MQSLEGFIAALHRELDAAFDQPMEFRSGMRLEAERITLSVNLDIAEIKNTDGTAHLQLGVSSPLSGGRPRANQRAKGSETHTLTIEFRNCPPPHADTADTSGAEDRNILGQPTEATSGPEFERVVKELSRLFGMPGFDSSARATVFREALDGLSHEQTEAVIRSLAVNAYEGTDPSVKCASQRIRRIFKAGPISSPKKGGELLEVLVRQNSFPSMIRLIKDTWKEQTDWLN